MFLATKTMLASKKDLGMTSERRAISLATKSIAIRREAHEEMRTTIKRNTVIIHLSLSEAI